MKLSMPALRPATAATRPGRSPIAAPRADSVEDSYSGTIVAAAPHNVLRGKQFADSCGRVTHLALMLSESYTTRGMRRQILDAYRTLFTEMEPDTRFTVVVESRRDQEDVEALLRDSAVPNPERVQILKPDIGSLTVWARDMMVPLFLPDDGAHTALLEQTPLHDWHDNDSKIPAVITQANPSILLDVGRQIVTDGGEVMANTRESFVGYYSIAATAERLERTIATDPRLQARVVAEYESRTGKQVVSPQGRAEFPFAFIPQEPLGHRLPYRLEARPCPPIPGWQPGQISLAQMYEDLAVELFEQQFGKSVNVMGKDDPETEHVEEPATDHLDMGLTPIDDETFFVGDPELTTRLLDEMSPEERQQVEARLAEQLGHPVSLDSLGPLNRDQPEDFENYVRIVEKKGYRVVRLPHAEPGRVGSPYISYNNCLMERFERDGQEIRRVFLPVYGIEKLDHYATQAWEAEGFEVHPMPLGVLSERWGALRCISNWLDRSDSA